jgi:hypothetical protein
MSPNVMGGPAGCFCFGAIGGVLPGNHNLDRRRLRRTSHQPSKHNAATPSPKTHSSPKCKTTSKGIPMKITKTSRPPNVRFARESLHLAEN